MRHASLSSNLCRSVPSFWTSCKILQFHRVLGLQIAPEQVQGCCKHWKQLQYLLSWDFGVRKYQPIPGKSSSVILVEYDPWAANVNIKCNIGQMCMCKCGRTCTSNTWHDKGLGLKTLLGFCLRVTPKVGPENHPSLGVPCCIYCTTCRNEIKPCATGWSGCELFKFPASFQIQGDWNWNPLRQWSLLMYMSCKWEGKFKVQGFQGK